MPWRVSCPGKLLRPRAGHRGSIEINLPFRASCGEWKGQLPAAGGNQTEKEGASHGASVLVGTDSDFARHVWRQAVSGRGSEERDPLSPDQQKNRRTRAA